MPIWLTAKYLVMPKKLLYRSLRLQLNHRMKKTKEKHFIVSRLKFFDQKFCLTQNIRLYQSYLNVAQEYRIWLASLHSRVTYLYFSSVRIP